MAKLSEFLTVGQAADYLGVSKDTLRRWDRSGKLVARRHPLTEFRLYLKSDLDSVLAGVTRSKPARGTAIKKHDEEGRRGSQRPLPRSRRSVSAEGSR